MYITAFQAQHAVKNLFIANRNCNHSWIVTGTYCTKFIGFLLDAEATPATFETPDVNARQETPMRHQGRTDSQKKRMSRGMEEEKELKKGNSDVLYHFSRTLYQGTFSVEVDLCVCNTYFELQILHFV